MAMPAAKEDDRIVGVDTHIVLVPTGPSLTPTPLPHPFNGTIDGKLSANVYIAGKKAATVGSTATNQPHVPTPPGVSFQKPPKNKATVQMGSTGVFINGKAAARNGDTCIDCNDPADAPTGKVVSQGNVFVGNVGSGSGGSSTSQDQKSESESQKAKEQFQKVRGNYAKQLGVDKGGDVHHAIELQVLDRYPGVYSSAELNDLENMRGIPRELTTDEIREFEKGGKAPPPKGHSRPKQLHNSKIREIWDRHYDLIDQKIEKMDLRPGTTEFRQVVRSHVKDAKNEIDYVLGQFYTEERKKHKWE